MAELVAAEKLPARIQLPGRAKIVAQARTDAFQQPGHGLTETGGFQKDAADFPLHREQLFVALAAHQGAAQFQLCHELPPQPRERAALFGRELAGNAVNHTQRAQLEAVQLLMARNREIYLACPEIPTFRERCNAFFHRHQHGC